MATQQHTVAPTVAATSPCEIHMSASFVERCSAFGVSPGRVLTEFMENAAHRFGQSPISPVANDGARLAFDYLNSWYGSNRSAAKRAFDTSTPKMELCDGI